MCVIATIWPGSLASACAKRNHCSVVADCNASFALLYTLTIVYIYNHRYCTLTLRCSLHRCIVTIISLCWPTGTINRSIYKSIVSCIILKYYSPCTQKLKLKNSSHVIKNYFNKGVIFQKWRAGAY